MKLRSIAWALLLGLLSLPVQAAYVTDQLLVGLHDTPDAAASPRRLLKSGTPLEVIETKGDFSQVRLADGGEGWVESAYLTWERPVRYRLLALQARLAELEQTAQTRPAPEPPGGEQGGQLHELAAQLQQARQRIVELQADTTSLTYHRTWPWVLAVMSLLVCLAAGVGVVERRLRQACR